MSTVRLHKVEPADLPFLYQWENDAATWADGANHNPLSHQDLRAYIESTTGDIYRDGQLRLIATADGQTIGCADLFDLDARNRRAAIGLYIAPEFRGRGLALQVLSELEQLAFRHLNLRVIYAIIRVSNEPCVRLFNTCQYTPSSPLAHWTLEGDAILFTKTNETGI